MLLNNLVRIRLAAEGWSSVGNCCWRKHAIELRLSGYRVGESFVELGVDVRLFASGEQTICYGAVPYNQHTGFASSADTITHWTLADELGVGAVQQFSAGAEDELVDSLFSLINAWCLKKKVKVQSCS
jgi:hypothetical protein